MPEADDPFENPDMNILSDVFNCPENLKRFKSRQIKAIIDNQPFVHFDHSYVDLCNLSYLPCNGKPERECPYKKNMPLRKRVRNRLFSTKCSCFGRVRTNLYKNAKLNVFVSPMHRDIIYGMTGCDRPAFIMKPLVNKVAFKNFNVERDIDFIFIGVVCEAKGSKNMYDFFKKNPDKNLIAIGNAIDNINLPNVKCIGAVEYGKIPEYLNRSKNFIYLPRWPEPQGRVVVEAKLCGCNLIINEMVGAMSFGNFEYPSIDDNCIEFWDTIQSIA
jgi:glycosyltransferase involved in cell wall biosynthesis